jgi:hypothetical protein
MEKEQLITLPYCMQCKGICFEYTQSETQYATVTYRYDNTGYDELIDTDTHDGETGDKFCPECGGELVGESITLPFDVYQTIHKKVTEEKLELFLCDFGKDEDGYEIDPSDFTPQEAMEKITEALL